MSTSAAMRTFTYKYHAGKLAVQRRAGTAEEAGRIFESGFVGTKISSSGESLLADPDLREVYLSSVDKEGLVWASVVSGTPGFVSESPSPTDPDSMQVAIDSGNRGFLTYEGDPLDENLQLPDAPVGMLIMSYRNRRRYRINGKIVSTTGGGNNDNQTPLSRVALETVMAMGNCPKYLHVRKLVREEGPAPRNPAIKRSTTLSQQQRDWIASADTFTLGTYADGQYGGADASNRGGNPGFVWALDDRTIVFPDYQGNNMYLSLGNIVANPRAGLLFINRETGDVLQVSGEARIVYAEETSGGDPALSGSNGKYVRIDVLAVVEAQAASPLRMQMEELSPYSPAVPSLDQQQQQQQQQQQVGSFLVRCTEALDVASGVKAFRFEPASPAVAEVAGAKSKGNGDGQQKEKALAWIPGQYATFFFPSCEGVGCGEKHEGLYTLPVHPSPGGGGNAEVVVRTWTITSVCGDNRPMEITVQAKAGGVSEQLHSDLKPGALVRVAVGGDFTLTDRLGAPPPDSRRKVLLLSAGIGVTPMIASLRWLRQRGPEAVSPDVVAVHATRTTRTVPFLPEIMEQIAGSAAGGAPADGTEFSADGATPARVRFVLAVTDGVGSDGNVGGGGGGADAVITNPHFYTVGRRPDKSMLRSEVPDIADRHVLLCGPDVFMAAMEGAMKELGVPSSRIHSEEFYF